MNKIEKEFFFMETTIIIRTAALHSNGEGGSYGHDNNNHSETHNTNKSKDENAIKMKTLLKA